ncbi:MAG: DUF4405 domain-containing protein [Rhizomicrobium sp.]
MDSVLRKYATPLSLVAFLAVAATGVMLFFDVRSRQLFEVHEWVGMIFVVALLLHLARNWRGMLAMMSSTRNKAIVGGLGVVALLFIIGSTPFGYGNGHGGGFGHGRQLHASQQVVHRLADAPIATMAPALGITGKEAISRLRKGGIMVEGPNQSLADIADKQDTELPRLLGLVMTEPEA